MKNNIDVLKSEIDKLVIEGISITTKEGSKVRNNNIAIEYNTWFSQAIPLIKLILPERFEEFMSYHNPSKTRKNIIYSTFRIADYITKVEETDIYEIASTFDATKTFINLLNMQIGMVESCKNRIESKLNNIKAILQSEVFDNELDSARHLYKNSFYRASGMLAGVVLETHLKSVCITHKIDLPKNPTISNYNELLKNADIIDITVWRHLSMMADIRNICSHQKGVEPTQEQCEDIIKGVDRIIKKVY